jgi:hypothetical protein
VPEVLLRRDDEGRLMIVVERAETEQVAAVAAQVDAGTRDESFQRDLFF